jgi:hypothetical protein
LLEAGLLLLLIPWSSFWDRNYFAESLPVLRRLMMNNFVRGGISGLGLVNIIAAVAELSEMLATSRHAVDEER